MKDSIIEKWEREMESEDLLKLGYIIAGLPKDYYENVDNLQDALLFAVEEFGKKHNLSEKTQDEMLDSILIRDAFYKMLEREGLTHESS